MDLANRSLVTVDDLSIGEMEGLFSLANEMSDSMAEQRGVCQGKVTASLFFEPSSRTRLSFEAAMHRLGGNVISAANNKPPRSELRKVTTLKRNYYGSGK